MESNWVVGIDALLFVFILAPLYSPRPFPAPPGGKEEPTAIFGHVFKARKYSLDKHVDIISSPIAALLSTVSTAGGTKFKFPKFMHVFNVPRRGCFLCFETWPNVGVSSLSRPAGRERAGGVSGAKNENGYILFNHYIAVRCHSR